MESTAYIETSVVGYLASRMSRDLVVAEAMRGAHIANAIKRGIIERVCEKAGYTMPVICTPEELPGEKMWTDPIIACSNQ